MTASTMPADAMIVWQPAPQQPRAASRSIFHRVALGLVWLSIALSSIAMVEPAPVDALLMGLMVLLPLVGLVRVRRELFLFAAAWLAIAAFGLVAANGAKEMGLATTHVIVTLYLSLAGIAIAAFVARNPGLHTRLILSGYLAACIIAAIPGIASYLSIPPFTSDMFTNYSRASGTFKDPNVFGAFLITGLLIVIHQFLTRSGKRLVLPIMAGALVTAGILFSFSRGAWFTTVLAIAVYSYLYMLTAQRDSQRLKLALVMIGGAAIAGLILAAATQSQAVENLLEERAALAQSYDVGPEGRFGGQLKAVDIILEQPLGIGAGIFTRYYHSEEAHNVFLSMFLAHGWLGGLIYLTLCAMTLALGFRHALRPTSTQPLFLVVYAGLIATIALGFLVDTDHWRHFFILMGVVWGLMTGDRTVPRRARIVSDKRPVLARNLLVIPPSRRAARIIRDRSFSIPKLPPSTSRRAIGKRRPPRLLA